LNEKPLDNQTSLLLRSTIWADYGTMTTPNKNFLKNSDSIVTINF